MSNLRREAAKRIQGMPTSSQAFVTSLHALEIGLLVIVTILGLQATNGAMWRTQDYLLGSVTAPFIMCDDFTHGCVCSCCCSMWVCA